MAFTSDNLRELFQSKYNMEKWYDILHSFFHAQEIKTTPERIDASLGKDQGFYLGALDTDDSYRIGLFYYKIGDGSVINKRVGLRNLVKTFINPNWGEFDVALAVFDSGDHWRLSFICDIKEENTDPKRFTYVFGDKAILYKTPVERFLFLQKEGISFDNLKKAFSVEALSNEFFDKYREEYANFIQYITGKRFVKSGNKWTEKEVSTPHAGMMKAFGYDEKKIRDYVKKLMGRVTFLHFLQRKGWMNGDLNYMQNMFLNSSHKDDYLDTVLEPLFFGILNTKPEERKALFEKNGWDVSLLNQWNSIPYLNGGLFECDKNDEVESKFPAEYFEHLFQFFSEYNFTIDENDPNDAEIGVDPEMLGKIFENLLEDNKDKGAFYTPKEIVRYMCRESMIAYLKTNVSLSDDKIEAFVNRPEEGIKEIPEEKKPELLKVLKDVKICDPAIGSGAFPMGLLNVLLSCHEVLTGEYSNRAEIKKSIIENNIYGVDIERGAVDIARLRFWLSIVVDEDTPSPLPNLDYKIMQGNSLMESYKGLDLSLLVKPVKNKDGYCGEFNFEKEEEVEQKNFSNLLTMYYSCSDHNQKQLLCNHIFESINTQLEAQGFDDKLLNELKQINPSENRKFFLWHTWFGDVFNKGKKDGGFDIVIGNPPYIQLQINDGELAKLYEDCGFKTFARTGDIYCLFYERGWQLLKKNGHLCYITSNKWMRAGYGEKTRDFFVNETNPELLIDFAGLKIFDSATVDTNILMFSKSVNKHKTKCVSANKQDKSCLKNLSVFVQQECSVCDFSTSDSWVILSPIEQNIKSKIETIGIPLKNWNVKIYRGILTGCNEAFIISTEKRNEILKNCKTEDERKKTEELIRPILRGRDIRRYNYDWQNLWLINAHNGIKGKMSRIHIEDYPSVKEHLDKFWVKIEKRADKGETPYNLRNCAYMEDFSMPKLFYADITQKLNFAYCDTLMYCNNTTYFITCLEKSTLKYLQSFLNSKLIDWYYRTLSVQLGEDAVRMFSIYVLKIPIPKSFNENIYKSYGLDEREIEFINSTVK